MNRAVYLDHNASTPVRREAAHAVAEALEIVGNASSVHGYGRNARHRLELARTAVADLVGISAENVVFTSGGTEANNLALRGFGQGRVIVSAGEHSSVLDSLSGVKTVPLLGSGVVDLDALESLLMAGEGPVLVSVMAANNETGVRQPVDKIAELVHAHGGLYHCDAVQAVGKGAFDMMALGVDLLSISAHKIGGPQGVGALVVSSRSEPSALLRGGGQERSRRAGTENLPGIAGFGAAASLARRELDRYGGFAALRDALEARLRAAIPELRIYGAEAPRLPNTSCFGVAGLKAEIQVMALDLAGVAVSAGSACSSGKVRPSHVLTAMGASPVEAACAIRVSFGPGNNEEDVEQLTEAWLDHYRRAVAA